MEETQYNTFYTPESIIEGKASNLESFFHLVCILGGAGIVQLPYAVMKGGWLSILWIPVSCFLLYFSGILIMKCVYFKNQRLEGFIEIGRQAFGSSGEKAVEWAQSSMLVGGASLFIILSSTNMRLLFPDSSISFETWLFISLIVSCVPFIIIKSLKEAAVLSVFGVFSTLIMISAIIFVSIKDYGKVTIENAPRHEIMNIFQIPFSMASISFSLGGITIFPHVEKAMSRPKDFNKVLGQSVIFIGIIYSLIAFCGYLTYGTEVDSPIFNNLSKGLIVKIAVFMLTIHLIVTIPLLLTNYALDTEPRIGIKADDKFKRILFRVLSSGLVYVIAITIPYFSDFMALLGALSNGLLLYIFPAIFYIKLIGLRNKKYSIMVMFLLFTGIFVCVIGTFQALLSLFDDIFIPGNH